MRQLWGAVRGNRDTKESVKERSEDKEEDVMETSEDDIDILQGMTAYT